MSTEDLISRSEKKYFFQLFLMFADTIKRAKDGDRKAMGILYDMTFDKVYRSVFHRVLDTYIAEDIVSQVYMKVIKGLRSFRGDTEMALPQTSTINNIEPSKIQSKPETQKFSIAFSGDFILPKTDLPV